MNCRPQTVERERNRLSDKLTWLFIFLLVYWGFCIFWGARSAQLARSPGDFFVAGRRLRTWVFIMAATATSFGGFAFLAQPGLIFRDGIQFVFSGLCAITIPLTGVVLLKRQWMLSKRFGYLTPGEMLADYYRSETIPLLAVAIGLVFAIPFLAALLSASGVVLNIVTDGWISHNLAVWAAAIVLLIYVTAGGIRAVAHVDTLQGILLAAGMVIIGLIALHLVGGFEALAQAMAKLASTDFWGTTSGFGGGDYSRGFAAPGVVQWTAGLGRELPVGGLWTGVMCLSFMLAFMGIQSSPAFSVLAFAGDSPRAFAPQQVWASSLAIGVILIFFVTFQGMGAHFLGANPRLADGGLAIRSVLPPLTGGNHALLVPYLINTVSAVAPWLAGFLAVCALAAIQSTAAAHIVTAGSMLSRDLYRRHINPSAPFRAQVLFSRMSMVAVTVLALLMATYAPDAILLSGGVALALGLQLWPSLLGVTWLPWITREGAAGGLVAGAIAVILTDSIGQKLTGNSLPWGMWPWTIHSAGWGIFFNVLICVVASTLSQNPAQRAHREKYHEFLRDYAALPAGKRHIRTAAWIIVIVWMFFSFGPGIVIGNSLFGAPGAGYQNWNFGMPSLWIWVIIWWGIGVVVMWFLAYKMEMSTAPAKPVVALGDDFDASPI